MSAEYIDKVAMSLRHTLYGAHDRGWDKLDEKNKAAWRAHAETFLKLMGGAL